MYACILMYIDVSFIHCRVVIYIYIYTHVLYAFICLYNMIIVNKLYMYSNYSNDTPKFAMQ